MKDELERILSDLKAAGFAVSKIETELGFSNGLLGKAKNGVAKLSDEKFAALDAFYKKVIPEIKLNNRPPDNTEDQPRTKLVVDKNGLKEKPSDKTVNEMRSLADKINKDYGEGTVMFLGDKPKEGYDVISTGSMGLDEALGIGGLPRGRIVEVFGPESGGKTSIAIHVMANAQKRGLKCLLIDAEYAFDPEYAANIGVNVENLAYCQPSCGEEGLEVLDQFISEGKADVVVVDSVAALIPKGELDGDMGESKMGLHARLMSQACRKIVGTVGKKNALVIFINQIRNKIGIAYGDPSVTTGGMALQFYCSVRLDVRRSTKIENGEVIVGNKVRVKVIKNKCSPPFRTAEFDIIYGQGINKIGELVDIGVQKGIIQKSGSWFSYDQNKIGQGREAVIQLLEDNTELAEEIEAKILATKK